MEPTAAVSSAAPDRLSITHQVTLSALWLGLNFQSSALLPIVVPAQILLLIDRGAVASSQQALAVSAISFGAAIIAIVVTPLAGVVSDRMKTRFGRRRRLIVAGILLALVGQAGVAVTTPLALFVVGLAIVAVGTNVITAAYQGLLPDLVRIFSVSINLPSLIAPALGGLVIMLAGAAGIGSLAYRLVFSLAAVSLLLGVVVVRRIRLA